MDPELKKIIDAVLNSNILKEYYVKMDELKTGEKSEPVHDFWDEAYEFIGPDKEEDDDRSGFPDPAGEPPRKKKPFYHEHTSVKEKILERLDSIYADLEDMDSIVHDMDDDGRHKGHWIVAFDRPVMWCRECLSEMGLPNIMYRYCPYCGAFMDNGDNVRVIKNVGDYYSPRHS